MCFVDGDDATVLGETPGEDAIVSGLFGTGTFTKLFEDPVLPIAGKGGSAGPIILVSASCCRCCCLGGVINDSNSRLKSRDEGEDNLRTNSLVCSGDREYAKRCSSCCCCSGDRLCT